MSIRTDARTALAVELWRKGYSASKVSEALGGIVSRNAVIGKMTRLGVANRGTPSIRHPNGGSKPRKFKAPKTPPKPRLAKPKPKKTGSVEGFLDYLSSRRRVRA